MTSSIIFKETADDFLKVCAQFKLGKLTTETPNPLTTHLSEFCETKELLVSRGLPLLKDVDVAALSCIVPPSLTGDQPGKLPEPLSANPSAAEIYKVASESSFDALSDRMDLLSSQIHETLEAGYNVIFTGCGATGRLALSLEVFAHLGLVDPKHAHQVLGIHTGGDSALLRSIPEFEDKIEYGVRQLYDTGFRDGDLVIAITEGGETPFVIAVCEEAAQVSTIKKPWFLYCNPDDVLCGLVERSKRVISNPKIEKINLYVGPMAITGSTRMQATTIQQLVAGLALAHHANPAGSIKKDLIEFATFMKQVDYSLIAEATFAEAQLYKAGEHFLYEPEDALACTVMTDSTERSPTFSLPVFENFDFPQQPSSAVYLHLRGSPTTSQAWLRLMRRPIRGLNWDATQLLTGNKVVLGYDFSDQVIQKRAKHLGDASKTHARVRFETGADSLAPTDFQNYLHISVGTEEQPTKGASLKMAFPTKWGLTAELEGSRIIRYHSTGCAGALVLVNIFVKMLLNAHSTAIMGHLKRFEQNVMTYVAPSNYKLIDRAARYIELLLKGSLPKDKPLPDYETIVRKIYDYRNQVKPGQPIVLLVREFFLTQSDN